MENQNIQEYVDDSTPVNKTISFLKNNILTILLILSCVAFVFKDMISIEESNKTIPEIIASGLLTLIMALVVDTIMSKKGTMAGLASKQYISTLERYGKEIDKTDPYIDKLDDYCDTKNDQRIIRAQKKILRLQRIKFEDFMEKTQEEVCGNDKEKIKAWNEAVGVKIHMLTGDYLLSETDDNYEMGKKEKTLDQVERNSMLSKLLSKVVCACITGYFGITIAFNKANLIWGAIQVFIWICWGTISYFQRYLYVVNTHRQSIIRKTKYLIEFNTIQEREVNRNGK